MTGSGPLTPDEKQALLVLVSLDRVGPARLRWMDAVARPLQALEALRAGRSPTSAQAPPGVSADLLAAWSVEARTIDRHDLWAAYNAAGISILTPGDHGWPFEQDPEPPSILFYQGDLDALQTPALVGIVGTRRCSALGRRVAHQLGAELATAGVGVVSGLALGIDGAAHRGSLAVLGAPPIGVVGTGIDRVYPPSNVALWEEVAGRGLLLSEAPLGAGPQRWRFPARNRLLAGLIDLLVVVESHASGGALLTVGEAADRGCPVVAVPGSVLAKTAEGSNSLLIDGCAPVRDARDVLMHLGLPEAPQRVINPIAPVYGSIERRILETLAAGATHVNQLIEQLGEAPPRVFAAVQSLVTAGVVSVDGSTAILDQAPALGPGASTKSGPAG